MEDIKSDLSNVSNFDRNAVISEVDKLRHEVKLLKYLCTMSDVKKKIDVRKMKKDIAKKLTLLNNFSEI